MTQLGGDLILNLLVGQGSQSVSFCARHRLEANFARTTRSPLDFTATLCALFRKSDGPTEQPARGLTHEELLWKMNL
jgi:hypothetical protein